MLGEGGGGGVGSKSFLPNLMSTKLSIRSRFFSADIVYQHSILGIVINLISKGNDDRFNVNDLICSI